MSEHLITDPTDQRLGHGVDSEPRDQHEVYLVLSDEERAKGFVRPVRTKYMHIRCPEDADNWGKVDEHGHPFGPVTRMGQALAETYARDPHFYGATYCVHCHKHLRVGAHGEFVWDDGTGQMVGT